MRRAAVLEAEENDESVAERVSNRERFKELAKKVVIFNAKNNAIDDKILQKKMKEWWNFQLAKRLESMSPV